MVKYTNSEDDYHKEHSPFLPDYLCHSDDSVSEFRDKMVHGQAHTLHGQRQG